MTANKLHINNIDRKYKCLEVYLPSKRELRPLLAAGIEKKRAFRKSVEPIADLVRIFVAAATVPFIKVRLLNSICSPSFVRGLCFCPIIFCCSL